MSKQNITTVLLTGGAGYIGSHICVELAEAGYNTVILDNLSNSSEESVHRVEKITGKQITFYKADLLDEDAVNKVFDTERIDVVIHLAGLKAVGESVTKPLEYYHNNITGTLNLINSMRKYNVKNFVFSSSATVYGTPKTVPITEDFPVGNTTNPYGETKLMIERILTDYQKANTDFNVVILRYFNPVGAHKSAMIGEDPKGIPNNLMPYISQVAVGKLACLNVFGNDYDTPDGTGVRDYIHVVDLANGHVKAIDYLKNHNGLFIFNLGTGKGYSVLDMVNAFGNACGKKINYTFAPRRSGDIAQCYANPEKAEKELDWKAQKTLEDMCVDTWNWQLKNPNGYEK